MKNKILLIILTGATLLGASSCATLFTNSKKEVMFKGIPHAELYDKKGKIGEISNNGFATIPLRKGIGKKQVTARKDGYADRTEKVAKKFNTAALWNILFGGIPGFLIDTATGKIATYRNKLVDVTQTPLDGTRSESVSVAVQESPSQDAERVSRDNAGNTAMERAIVRWNIESDPSGARIFWRVISSVPDEVKNTNETYLTTTPYEETRSFNILGLTYENARDVTIEIKLTKKGYNPQVKRFNVRQALDQQEISTFFELVKED